MASTKVEWRKDTRVVRLSSLRVGDFFILIGVLHVLGGIEDGWADCVNYQKREATRVLGGTEVIPVDATITVWVGREQHGEEA